MFQAPLAKRDRRGSLVRGELFPAIQRFNELLLMGES